MPKQYMLWPQSTYIYIEKALRPKYILFAVVVKIRVPFWVPYYNGDPERDHHPFGYMDPLGLLLALSVLKRRVAGAFEIKSARDSLHVK